MLNRVMRPLLCAAVLFMSAAAAEAQTAALPAPPAVTWQVNVSGYTFRTNNPNATGALDTVDGADTGSRTDYSNILAAVTRTTGRFRFSATVGAYAFPVVGQTLNPTFKAGANTDIYGIVPVAFVQFVPDSRWTFSAGKLPTLIGQENVFTFQNANVQRGLLWSTETTISRGIRATYAQGKFTGNLEFNDGFYSGRLNTLEGAAQWAASDATMATFAFVLPPANAGPNPTASIANKREGALMVTQHFGKLALTPYLQWIDSPANAALGFAHERAFGAVMIADYTFGAAWSVGARFESLADRSAPSDPAANADLVGYGPGSKATTWTLTPAFRTANTTIRLELSSVALGAFSPGFGFGTGGMSGSQARYGLEVGTQF